MLYGKAAVLVKPNQLETWEVPIADPEPGGALVKVVVGGVCGSDFHIVSGDAGEMPFPIILGHEGVGRLEKLGAGVKTDYAGTPVRTGDMVYWVPIAQCHRCRACTVLDEMPCENSQFFEHAEKPNWGSYADYAWLPNGLAFFKLPDGANPDAVASLGCGLPTALGGIAQCGPIQVGENVVVQGAGQVGLASVMVASLAGAKEIVVLDHSEKRLNVARSMGATATISLAEHNQDERKRMVADLLGPQGANVVIEAAGVLPAFPEGMDLTSPYGRYIILGLWGAIGKVSISARDFSTKNMKIAGASFHKPKFYHQALELASRHQDRFGLASLVTHRFAIKDADKALEAAKNGTAIKPVIDPSLS
jgi:threonine dehydrogenase-like Zn-dependent dehydrogenase